MRFKLVTVSSNEITQAQTAEVIALCSDVFQMDYAFYMNLGLYRVHVLGYEDGYLVSHALWLERNCASAPGRGATPRTSRGWRRTPTPGGEATARP